MNLHATVSIGKSLGNSHPNNIRRLSPLRHVRNASANCLKFLQEALVELVLSMTEVELPVF